MAQHLQIEAIIDPSDATVIVQRDADGRLSDAHFDLLGLPRVDKMMVGRPVSDVPGLAERLCGICPVAHHLAGVQALEALSGPVTLTPTVQAVRQLLNFGSVIDSHLLSFIANNLAEVKVLRRFAKLACKAAGSPKHFPTTATPGGVAQVVDSADLVALVDSLAEALTAAEALVAAHEADEPVSGSFDGADAALVDAEGHIDLMGQRLRVIGADGTVLVVGASPDQWAQIVAEAAPGTSAPRPYLLALGPLKGIYRTGPVAQLRVGPLGTPLAAAAQQRWLAGQPRAALARAIITLHCVEAIGRLCEAPALLLDDIGQPLAAHGGGIGTGWIETGRGLLVHRYEADADGAVIAATILTPTAQNEPWLAALLQQACQAGDIEASMEDAIREADPCLPCSSAPKGQMGLVVAYQDAGAAPGDTFDPLDDDEPTTGEFLFDSFAGRPDGATDFGGPAATLDLAPDFGSFAGLPGQFGRPANPDCGTSAGACFLGDMRSSTRPADPPAPPYESGD